VEVILDKFNLKSKKTLLKKLISERICVRIDKPKGVAHNKVVIIDDRILITGSYNFSTSSYERNTENVLVIHDHTLAHEYLLNWQKRWDISTNPSQMGCRVKLPSAKYTHHE
jgi:phospholipase D